MIEDIHHRPIRDALIFRATREARALTAEERKQISIELAELAKLNNVRRWIYEDEDRRVMEYVVEIVAMQERAVERQTAILINDESPLEHEIKLCINDFKFFMELLLKALVLERRRTIKDLPSLVLSAFPSP